MNNMRLMKDDGFAEEKRLTFQADRKAYESLGPRQQRLANRLGAIGFGSRTVVVTTWKILIGIAGGLLDIVLFYPYRLGAKLVRLGSNAVVKGVMFGVDGLTGLGRAFLATARGALRAGGAAVRLLQRIGLLRNGRGNGLIDFLGAGGARLLAMRDRLVVWGAGIKKGIGDSYTAVKNGLIKARTAAFEFAEYYGALGLYRGMKWLLDPRNKKGEPLFGEKMNRIAGLAGAGVGFFVLATAMLQLGVLAKIWHIKLAATLITDKNAPLWLNLAKQAPLHVLITGGITALKFFGLPPLAATRQALKSTQFNRGVAYQYNSRLLKVQNIPAPKPSEGEESLSFLEHFIEHVVVEKAAPEFYEARLKYYQDKLKPSFNKNAPPPAPEQPKPEAPAPKEPPEEKPGQDQGRDKGSAPPKP
jgi:hypothetical protein